MEHFPNKIDDPLLNEMVIAGVSSNMKDAEYRYFVHDDGWMTMEPAASQTAFMRTFINTPCADYSLAFKSFCLLNIPFL